MVSLHTRDACAVMCEYYMIVAQVAMIMHADCNVHSTLHGWDSDGERGTVQANACISNDNTLVTLPVMRLHSSPPSSHLSHLTSFATWLGLSEAMAGAPAAYVPSNAAPVPATHSSSTEVRMACPARCCSLSTVLTRPGCLAEASGGGENRPSTTAAASTSTAAASTAPQVMIVGTSSLSTQAWSCSGVSASSRSVLPPFEVSLNIARVDQMTGARHRRREAVGKRSASR